MEFVYLGYFFDHGKNQFQNMLHVSQTNSKSSSQFVCAFFKNVFTRRSCNCQCDGPHCLMGEKLNSFTKSFFLRIAKIRTRSKWSWLETQWYLTACPNKDGPEAASSLGHLFLNNRDKTSKQIRFRDKDGEWLLVVGWWHNCVTALQRPFKPSIGNFTFFN